MLMLMPVPLPMTEGREYNASEVRGIFVEHFRQLDPRFEVVLAGELNARRLEVKGPPAAWLAWQDYFHLPPKDRAILEGDVDPTTGERRPPPDAFTLCMIVCGL